MRVNQLAKELCVMRSPAELRDDQWVTTVFHMRVRAGLTGQETRDILTFLQSSNSSLPATGLMTPVSLSTLSGTPDFTQKDGRLSKSDSDFLRC